MLGKNVFRENVPEFGVKQLKAKSTGQHSGITRISATANGSRASLETRDVLVRPGERYRWAVRGAVRAKRYGPSGKQRQQRCWHYAKILGDQQKRLPHVIFFCIFFLQPVICVLNVSQSIFRFCWFLCS